MSDLRSWLLELARDTLVREGGRDTAHDLSHIERVMALAETIQQHEGGDLPVIWAAVALHDIGQERERRRGGDHAQIGAEMAAELLRNTPFPQESIAAVQEAIRDHRLIGSGRPGRPRSLEGCILYDADKLDGLGAIGIARLYILTGQRHQPIYAPLPQQLTPPGDPRQASALRNQPNHTPYAEFHLFFQGLAERLQTATGRSLARERYQFMEEFFRRLAAEAGGTC
jgi:uncharacterized protein